MTRPDRATGVSAASGDIVAIVLVYAAFAALWILLSDRALALLIHDPATMALASTLKGWLFVAVTSVLLYVLIRRLRLATGVARPPRLKSIVLPLAITTAVVVAITAFAIAHDFSQHKDRELDRLQAIADLRSEQVARWLQERLGDARFLQRGQIADHYLAWRRDGNAAAREKMFARMKELASIYDYQDVALLDGASGTMENMDGQSVVAAAELLAAARTAIAENGVAVLGPYRDAHDRIHLDFIAALGSPADNTGAAIVMHSDPDAFLYPTLRRWPSPSDSAETLLVRRDGDAALFLSELRHEPGSAARKRLPIDDLRFPATQAVAGKVGSGGITEAIDYRQVPVLASVHAVPGTDWFLIAKVDRAEVYAEAGREAAWIALSALLALLMAGTGIVVFRQRQQLLISLVERAALDEKLHSLKLLDAISASSPDGVFAKDRDGRYLFFNAAAEPMFGKPVQSMLGQDSAALFDPDTARELAAEDRQVMAANRLLTFQRVVALDGERRTLHVVKGPLRDAEGNVAGVFGVARDITDRVRDETALRATEELKQAVLDSMPSNIARARRRRHHHRRQCPLAALCARQRAARRSGAGEYRHRHQLPGSLPQLCRCFQRRRGRGQRGHSSGTRRRQRRVRRRVLPAILLTSNAGSA